MECQPNEEPIKIKHWTDAVQNYLRKVVALRRSFDTFQEIQGQLDEAWNRLPDNTREWLAHLDHHEYQKLKAIVADECDQNAEHAIPLRKA